MCVCVYVCMYVRICLSVCARVYVCVKERERERERERKRGNKLWHTLWYTYAAETVPRRNAALCCVYVCEDQRERERERERKVGRSSPENGAIKADIGGSAIDINTIKYLSFAGDLDGWVGQSVGRSVGWSPSPEPVTIESGGLCT